MYSGTIKWFNIDKGFGFIDPGDDEADIFMHVRNLVHGQAEAGLVPGARVTFDLAPGDKGPRAVKVRIEPAGSNGIRFAAEPEQASAEPEPVTLAEGLAGIREAALSLLEWVEATMAAARAAGIDVQA